ncbi:MAG: nucleotide sugar dehydrogenase [Coriobacteriales bacterium]|nr:nucleotide sugar dehydrogenase [Coriobacteriales bacterium]
MDKRVCVIGCGYIGLPTSAMFASSGCDMLAVDLSEKVVDNLNAGRITIEEPGLAELVADAVAAGKLRAALAPEPADAFIIAVPTPFVDDGSRACDLSYVMAAVESVLPVLEEGNLLVVESTIAPRSIDDFVVPAVEAAGFRVGESVFVAHCPERVLPGKIIYELVHNNRIIGGVTPACTAAATELYRTFVVGEILQTEAKVAELSKCMENTFRDVNIALANELAMVCDELDIDCLEVIRLANKHPRVNLHTPGPGVGGHCLAIDPYFICAKAPETAKLIKLARDINCGMPEFVCGKVDAHFAARGIAPKSAKVVALGVTYKGNIDDCRQSPAMDAIALLEERGYSVAVFDPHVEQYGCSDPKVLFEGADLAIVLTDHNEFKGDALGEFVAAMRTPIIYDTRNIVSTELVGAQVYNFGNGYEF